MREGAHDGIHSITHVKSHLTVKAPDFMQVFGDHSLTPEIPRSREAARSSLYHAGKIGKNVRRSRWAARVRAVDLGGGGPTTIGIIPYFYCLLLIVTVVMLRSSYEDLQSSFCNSIFSGRDRFFGIRKHIK